LTIGKQQPTDGAIYTIGCVGQANHAFLSLKVDISNEDELLFLIDTGADISLLKGNKLIGTTEYDTEKGVKLKCVDGSPMENHGVLEAQIELHNSSVVHGIQLVNKQVDIPCDGILGRDFLQHAKAKVCYESQTVTLNGKEYKMVNETEKFGIRKHNKLKIGQIKLPPRTESIVRVPVKPESPLVGRTNRCEIQEGVIMAASLTKVMNGYAMTIILNTNDVEVNMQEPSVELDEIDPTWDRNCSTLFESQDRERKILTQLKLEHLNTEERKLLFQTCSAYQDIFYLPGDRLSSTDAAQHTITVETGTEPINTRPYRLPETQKVEVGKQVKKLLQEGTIEESSSPWNSPILVVPKRIDASGQQKFRLVVDYKGLNEKRWEIHIRYQTLQRFLSNWGKRNISPA